MVYWLFSSFVTETLTMLLQKVIEYGTESYASGSDADKKLDQLKTTLLSVQSLINQAESRHASDDYAWQHLLQKLEAAAYDADDLIDEIAIQVSKWEPRNRKHKELVSKLVLSLYKRKEAPNMTEIQSELERLLREIDSLCNRQRDAHGRPLEMIENKLQQTTCLIDYPVFGRESDQRNVINMLVASEQSSRTKNVSIVPIVGMMGVGKTTLAQLVYNNYPGTEAHPFSLKMWVSVTTPFDVMRLTRSILEAATEAAYRGASTSNLSNREITSSQLSDLNSLHVRLKEILEGNKFMLVLDDLWNVKRTEWNLLFRPLRGGAKGSTIIVTTESHRVVSWLVGAATPYCLQRLSDEDCWLVFKNEALEDMNLDAFPEFEMIGRKIAKKCDGSPLVAKLIGMHLYQTLDENQWNNVLKNFSSLIRNEVSPALKWGYHRLPSHVRHCFAYCSMFPQGYDFEKDKIVQMWIAEGFIIPNKEGNLRIEDVGNEYFHQLCSKSFFQMEREKYKMHDALHGLAQSVSSEKFSRMEKTNRSGIIDQNTRHLSLVCDDIQAETFEASCRCKGLRTFLLLRESVNREVPSELFWKLGRLRVLDLSSSRIKALAGNIGNLKHLRFLDLSNTLLKSLPDAIHKLCVLQTLRVRNCSDLLKLPRTTGRLSNLRHIVLDANNRLTSMPSGIGKLIGLETISDFIVGSQKGQLKELKELNKLRGSLCIKQLQNASSYQEAEEAKLANKKNLDRLELQWGYNTNPSDEARVLNNLQPHKELKELTLTMYGGCMLPSWVCNPEFSELTSICLNQCRNCVLLPSLGKLPKLKSLKIVGMHELTSINRTFLGEDNARFKSLETLEFRDMRKLEDWLEVGDSDMPLLRELAIVECAAIKGLPSLHYLLALEKLSLEECPQLPSLPAEGLPRSLQSLIITRCPMLEDRCRSDGGDDWMKIKDIPKKEIGYRLLP